MLPEPKPPRPKPAESYWDPDSGETITAAQKERARQLLREGMFRGGLRREPPLKR